jgi:hypothetical protein
MKQILIAVFCTFLSLNALADSRTSAAPDPGTTASYCSAADCGSLPSLPGETGVGSQGGEQDTCVKSTNYKTCTARCKCQYEKAYQKCGTWGLLCKERAKDEKAACDGMCITDYIDY